MYLYSKLQDYKKNINIGIIGCGKFISMFLSQYHSLNKIIIHTIVDIDVEKAKKNCYAAGLNKDLVSKINFSTSIDSILEKNDIDIVVEATGNAVAGITNAIQIIKNHKDIIMVNVEADVVAGKYMSDLADKYNVIYSMAYGDQPSLIIEQIEWGLVNGFNVIAAGKGTKYHHTYKYSTPDTVWDNYGIHPDIAIKAGMNKKMFNSFITGDKSAIEMTAVVNASHLHYPKNGLSYLPISVDNIAKKLIPKKKGGVLNEVNQVEVISSINEKKEKILNDLRWGVFIVIEGKNDYVKSCFKQYGIITDDSGYYSAIWRPYHYVGLELAQSIYNIALKREPTGKTKFFKADVASIAKKDLVKGDLLDGEGGFTVRGEGISAKLSKRKNILPIGLSDGAKVKENIKKNELITIDKVDLEISREIQLAREYQFNLLD
ncbi:MAG: hypothetical protein CFH34_01308 [Alphaproteobacteria bacterium MarineAlpha9_Bin4]|nr:homoserine dehydrogenase [Pelagibacterales bacterium]PPR25708.1 MAG: hypothetical protein CFH34_01308 [Alphaproteobacteria bacterium MarineAlpha9_Bin4]|tara:strand:- start:428 stop:1723 length:1296 start_codon:yes stop_codon:yes gene_type:complete